MKKGWKIFWIVCACMAGLGAALCIGGCAMGATFAGVEQALWKWGDYVEEKEYLLEKKVDVLEEKAELYEHYDDEYFGAAEEAGDGADVEEYGTWEGGNLDGASKISEYTIASLDGIGELDVNVSHLLVEIQESEDAQIEFITDNIPAEVEDELMLVQDGDELEVFIRNEKKWKRALNKHAGIETLTIRIPKEHRLRAMSLCVGGGMLEADNIQVGELDVAVGAGEANITQIHVNTLDVEVGAGEVNIAGTVTAKANIECGIGSVDYEATGSQQDYSYDVEVGVGVVSIGDEEYSGIVNNKTIKNGGPLMEIECGIGEVNITFAE